MSASLLYDDGFLAGEAFLCAGGCTAIEVRESEEAVVLTAARSRLYPPIEAQLTSDQAEHLGHLLLNRASRLRSRQLQRRLAEIFAPFRRELPDA